MLSFSFQDGKSGKTVIHYAAESGNTLLLEFLLQYPSVNIQFRTYSGLTAIMLADGRGYNDIVYQLQKFGGLLENVAFEESSDSDEDMVRNLIFRNFISDLLKSFDFHVFQVNILSDLIFFI